MHYSSITGNGISIALEIEGDNINVEVSRGDDIICQQQLPLAAAFLFVASVLSGENLLKYEIAEKVSS